MPEINKREMSTDFIEMLVLIHRKFYRGMQASIPLNQFAVLMVLRVEEPASPQFIGNILHISKQQMTSICEKLTASGLIQRETHRRDRRRVLISLTSAGERLIEDQNEIVRQKFIRSLKNLRPEEQDALANAIDLLNRSIEKMATAD